MKTFMTCCAVFIFMFSFTSCDEIDKLTEYDFDTTLNESFNVTVSAGDINEIMPVNISNSDTKKYLDVLQDVDITSFTYRIINFNGDTGGTIVGSFQADGNTLVTHDIVVSNEVGTDFEVNDVSALKTIASKLKSGQDVRFGLTGIAVCDPKMTFTIEMTIVLAITADVL